MMATAHALLEAEALKQLAKVVKTNGRVGRTAEKASERFLSAHGDIIDDIVAGPWRPGRVLRLGLRGIASRGAAAGARTPAKDGYTVAIHGHVRATNDLDA